MMEGFHKTDTEPLPKKVELEEEKIDISDLKDWDRKDVEEFLSSADDVGFTEQQKDLLKDKLVSLSQELQNKQVENKGKRTKEEVEYSEVRASLNLPPAGALTLTVEMQALKAEGEKIKSEKQNFEDTYGATVDQFDTFLEKRVQESAPVALEEGDGPDNEIAAEALREERYSEIVKEIEDNWIAKNGPIVRELSENEIAENKKLAQLWDKKWDGGTTQLTKAGSEFYFDHSGNGAMSVPTRAEKELLKRYPEYAVKKEVPKKISSESAEKAVTDKMVQPKQEAQMPLVSKKEFSSPDWVDNFSGFKENENLSEDQVREALEVMKDRFEELKQDETVDRSEELENYGNSVRNSELAKKYPELVAEYVGAEALVNSSEKTEDKKEVEEVGEKGLKYLKDEKEVESEENSIENKIQPEETEDDVEDLENDIDYEKEYGVSENEFNSKVQSKALEALAQDPDFERSYGKGAIVDTEGHIVKENGLRSPYTVKRLVDKFGFKDSRGEKISMKKIEEEVRSDYVEKTTEKRADAVRVFERENESLDIQNQRTESAKIDLLESARPLVSLLSERSDEGATSFFQYDDVDSFSNYLTALENSTYIPSSEDLLLDAKNNNSHLEEVRHCVSGMVELFENAGYNGGIIESDTDGYARLFETFANFADNVETLKIQFAMAEIDADNLDHAETQISQDTNGGLEDESHEAKNLRGINRELYSEIKNQLEKLQIETTEAVGRFKRKIVK